MWNKRDDVAETYGNWNRSIAPLAVRPLGVGGQVSLIDQHAPRGAGRWTLGATQMTSLSLLMLYSRRTCQCHARNYLHEPFMKVAHWANEILDPPLYYRFYILKREKVPGRLFMGLSLRGASAEMTTRIADGHYFRIHAHL